MPNGRDYAPNNPDIQHEPGSHDVTRGEMFNGHDGSSEFTPAGQKDFNKWISRNGGYEVRPGDSVWKLSEQYLHSQGVDHPTTYDSNGWLTAGDTIKIK